MMAYTVTTLRDRVDDEPWLVVVSDERNRPIAEMSALSAPHARKVAEGLALLLRRQRPGRSVVMASEKSPGASVSSPAA